MKTNCEVLSKWSKEEMIVHFFSTFSLHFSKYSTFILIRELITVLIALLRLDSLALTSLR